MGQPGGPLSASMEDYLEAIGDLQQADGVARVRDIAAAVGVNPSAVTGALRSLAAQGLVHYEPYQYITLTEAGREIASAVRRRHEALVGLLRDVLRLDPQAAQAKACQWEHAVDRDLRLRIEALVQTLQGDDRPARLCRKALERRLETLAMEGPQPASREGRP